MAIINGVKINNTKDEIQTDAIKKPSINEVLEKMQVNYNNLNNYYSQSNNVSVMSNTEPKEQTSSANTNSSSIDNNILVSLLPLLLNNKSNGASTETVKKEQNELFRALIKNLNNPLLEKLFELLPTLSKKNSVKKVEVESVKKNEPKIDSFVKTDEYNQYN